MQAGNTASYASPSRGAWNKVFSATHVQSDTDSSSSSQRTTSQRLYSPSESSGSSLEDTECYANPYLTRPQGGTSSPADNKVLRRSPRKHPTSTMTTVTAPKAQAPGAAAASRTKKRADGGTRSSNQSSEPFVPPPGFVALNPEDFDESWRGVADKGYLQESYEHARETVVFDWDGVEDRLLVDPHQDL